MITALGTVVFMSLDGNCFDFQRINDKIKDGLVLDIKVLSYIQNSR
jgi:hypothetical protein